ncbi:MAG: KH domain-containing protein [Promethearchaeota archaeon]
MKVRKSRIAVIIGRSGETKKELEKKLGIKIELDSNTGDCEVLPDFKNPNYNPLNVYTAQKIIKAINRGFNPVKAMKLMDEMWDLEIFNLQAILGKSEKRIKRIKGRIIGRNGEMRKAIEKYAECLEEMEKCVRQLKNMLNVSFLFLVKLYRSLAIMKV